MDTDDVRMRHLPGEEQLTLETCFDRGGGAGIGDRIGPNDLERERDFELGVPRLVHRPHPANAEQSDDSVPVPNTSPTSSGPSSASRAGSVRRRLAELLLGRSGLGEAGVHVDSSSIPALVGSSDAPRRVASESSISGASGSTARAARPAPAIPSAPSTAAPPDARAGASGGNGGGPVGLSNHLTASACLGFSADGAGPTGPFRKPVA